MNRKIVGDLGQFIKMRYGVEIGADNITLMRKFVELTQEIDKQVLDTYFGWDQKQGKDGGYWTQQLQFEKRQSGRRMVDYINSMSTESTILDVGCGDNEFKQHFGDRLVGIDPFNKRADIVVSIEDFRPKHQFDIVLALGSINFGDRTVIAQQVAKVVGLCKPGGKIFWRCNPGITHDHDRAKWIDFFEWSEENIQQFATESNCKVNQIGWDHPNTEEVRWGNRLYSEWTKSVFRSPPKQ
jgi:hypothetical protein